MKLAVPIEYCGHFLKCQIHPASGSGFMRSEQGDLSPRTRSFPTGEEQNRKKKVQPGALYP